MFEISICQYYFNSLQYKKKTCTFVMFSLIYCLRNGGGGGGGGGEGGGRGGGGGRGVSNLVFSSICRLWYFLGFKILNFIIFGGFQKN